MTPWPRSLDPDVIVAVVSPASSPLPFPRRRRRAESELRRRFADVRLGPGWARDVHGQAGTPEERAEEFNEAVSDDDVNLIMLSTGGFSTNEALPHVDFDLVADRRPLVCGYSDGSALLLAIHARTGLVCLHGPTALPTYGEAGGADDFTHSGLLKMLHGSGTVEFTAPPETTGAWRLWDVEDGERRVRTPSAGWVTLVTGSSEGRLVAANLETFERLVGTPYLPSLEGSVLCLEEAGDLADRTRSRLTHLMQAGVLDGVAGLAFGRFPEEATRAAHRVHDRLIEIGTSLGVPVVANVDFGHTEPRLTLPLGAWATLDADRRRLVVRIRD